jgi:hypothetical protein
VPIYQIPVPGVLTGHLETLYRDRAYTQFKLHLAGKKHAIPSLHRDNFPAKVPGPVTGARVG